MKRTKAMSLALGALLFMGMGAVTLSAEMGEGMNASDPFGKCGAERQQKIQEHMSQPGHPANGKCGTGKCGAGTSTMPSDGFGKCGAERQQRIKEHMSQPGHPANGKCGKGKCGA